MTQQTPLRRGSSAERELVYRLWSSGFAAIRAPASGAKAKKVFYPDVVAIYKGKVFVFEVKMRKDFAGLSINREKMEKLLEFARRAGGKAYIALKLRSQHKWLIIEIEEAIIRDASVSKKRYVRITQEYLNSKSMTISEFINKALNIPLNTFIEKRTKS